MNIAKEGNIKDVDVSKISIQRNGLLAIFCGQYDAALINLNDHKMSTYTSIGKKLKVITTCQWSKHGDNIAIGVDNICKIYDSDMTKLQSLKGHNMKISSVDWHPGTKHHIISSSYDTSKSICIWDIRKPVALIAKKDVSVIQQVKWHKFNTYVFATSSDTDLQIWDQRNISSPTNVISAHSSYVSDFDWFSREGYWLISCSQYEQNLKLWNITENNQSLKCQVDESVSMSHCKLNSTGNNLITLTIPENSADNKFILWDISPGYEVQKRSYSALNANAIVDFDWRPLSADKHQLVSLHNNFDYKVWDVENSIASIKKIAKDSFVKRASLSNERFYLSPSPLSLGEISNNITTVFSETFTHLKTNETLEHLSPRYSDSNLAIKSRIARLNPNDLDSKIQKEFDRLKNTMQIAYEKTLDKRSIIAHLNMINARCSIMFTYQCTSTDGLSLEAFVIPEKTDKLRKQNIDELEKILKNISSKNSFGISKCIDAAMDYINKLSARVTIRSVRSNKDSGVGPNFFSILPDVKVPYPRTCGATFSASGHLVCFLLPTGYQNKFHKTPRSYVDFVKHSNSTAPGKDFFYGYNVVTSKAMPHRSSKIGSRKNKAMEGSGDMDYSSRMHSLQNVQKHNFHVYIYNAQRLSLFCPELAKKYSIDVSDIEKMCEQNATVVSEMNRKDLSEFWQYCIILAKASRPNVNEFTNKIKPWTSQLPGRQMCCMWLEHFMKIIDIQSSAMLILVMMAIDARFDIDFETKYHFSQNTCNKKNISPESNQDNQCTENNSITSLTSGVNIIVDGGKVFRLYDDKSNSVLIISDGSFEHGHSRFYSNSYSELDHTYSLVKRPDTYPEMIQRHIESCRLIDPNKLPKYGLIMLQYAQMLSAQNLLTTATKITRKVLPATFFNNLSIQEQFSVRFIQAGSDSNSLQSNRLDDVNNQLICPDYSQRHLVAHSSVFSRHQDSVSKSQGVHCSICRLSVYGLLSLCAQCNHGGHMNHITAWFARTDSPGFCPTGCGCQCSAVADNNIQEMIST